MARLAAQENLEYYPTQEAIRPLIRSYLKFPAKGTNCLDPCCGPGDAFAEICPEQKLFGIEYHPVRADEAKSRLYKVLSSPLENCTISNRAFGFVHCNPPYDWAYGGKVRYEELFLARSTQYLSLNGVLELLVPTTLFKYRGPAVLKHLYENYTDLLFLRYPSPEFDKFKQLVIFGVRKPRERIIVNQEFLMAKAKKIYMSKLPILGHQSKPLYKVPQLNPGEVKIFRSSYYITLLYYLIVLPYYI